MPFPAVLAFLFVVIGAIGFALLAVALTRGNDVQAFVYLGLALSALWASRTITRRMGAR